jgi:hypothetical protein
MRLSRFFYLSLAAALIFVVQGPAWSGEVGLMIKDGGTVSFNNQTLYLNCLDVRIEAGGLLDLNSGIIEDSGRIYVQSGGSFIRGDGITRYCQPFLPPIFLMLLE